MIKYPRNNKRNNIKYSTLKDAVNADTIKVGQRILVGDNSVTCVHIDGNKYIFSMNDIFKTTSHDKIIDVLRTIWNTGMIDDLNIIPMDMMKDIDFLFIPTERQVFGKNKYGRKENNSQFEWFKHGNVTRKRVYEGADFYYWDKDASCCWWLATPCSNDNSRYCGVDITGFECDPCADNIDVGVPIFFQVTKES